MGELDTCHLIVEEQLNQQYYMQSLLEQAATCGLLTDTEFRKLQNGLLILLAEQTDKWNKGESSSIPVERAQDMMNSILFVISLQLKTYATPEQAVEILKQESLQQLHEEGLAICKRKLTLSRQLQNRMKAKLLNTPNVYYRSTIVDGINGFFKLYQPQFAAHEIHITADYPAYLGRPNRNGIEFIEEYLRYLEAENTFCMCFAPKRIHFLLSGLTKDYPSIPMNLFEPVLVAALGLILLEREYEALQPTKADQEELERKLQGLTKWELQDCLRKASLRLCQEHTLPFSTKRYIDRCIPRLTVTIQNALAMKTLDKVFLVSVNPGQEINDYLLYDE